MKSLNAFPLLSALFALETVHGFSVSPSLRPISFAHPHQQFKISTITSYQTHSREFSSRLKSLQFCQDYKSHTRCSSVTTDTVNDCAHHTLPSQSDPAGVAPADTRHSPPQCIGEQLKVLWDFSRPHTIIGSIVALTSIFMYTLPPTLWFTPSFLLAWITALIPSLLVNFYITGLNQITDIDIDKINKPYLPIPSGRLTKQNAIKLVLFSLFVSLAIATKALLPMKLIIVIPILLGSIYSLPPFRFKRYPILAALCILTVRGIIINLGFSLYAKEAILGLPTVSSFSQVFDNHKDSLALSGFFSLFGLIIALMKDTPDVDGDKKNNIGTLAVRLGANRMFR